MVLVVIRIPAGLKNAGDHQNALLKERQDMWIRALKRGILSDSQIKYGRVCSKHFKSGQPAELLDKDHPDWIPNQDMGYFIPQGVGDTHINWFQRSKKRRKQLDEQEQNPVHKDEHIAGTSNSVDEEIEIVKNHLNESTQTELTTEDLTKIMKDFTFLNGRVYTLGQKLKKLEITEKYFKHDDSKTLYYTGLPNAEKLFILFEDIKNFLPVHPNKVLSQFQQFISTFMKHLNLPFTFLSYQFNVAPSTCSRFVYDCVDIMYERVKVLIFWPSSESFKKTCQNVLRSHLETR